MNVFVFVALCLASAQAGCEWYKNCGACVADSGCGWCSNDPRGVGSGTIHSLTTNSGKDFAGINDAGYQNQVVFQDVTTATVPPNNAENGVSDNWLINVRGQYLKVDSTSDVALRRARTAEYAVFPGTGYLASPYFNLLSGNANRNKGVVGVHKTKFTSELKAGYTVTPYNQAKSYIVSSVQSDTQATMSEAWSTTFTNIEFQVGNIDLSGTFSYPDTSTQDVYGSWPPNPTKFTTELKDGFTIKCKSAGCGGANVRVLHVIHDQHLRVLPRFNTTFADKQMTIEIGARGTGLVSGTTGNTRLEGSDPCRTSAGEPCHENTRFLTELRINDRVRILNNGSMTCMNQNKGSACHERTVASILDNAHMTLGTALDTTKGHLHTNTKFQILSYHSTPFTYSRKAPGGLHFAGDTASGTTKIVHGYQKATFTKNLMAGYALIAEVVSANTKKYERRTIKSIDSATSLTLDEGFTAAVGSASTTATYYNYESCPSLTYENFDLRTENGFGVITNSGTNEVYDNVQYSHVTTESFATNRIRSARFLEYLKVGYTITVDGVTRTVTKMVDNTLIHIDRAFKTGTAYNKYSYRYAVRKTGDFHLHWKPRTEWGDYHHVANASNAMVYARSRIASATTSGTAVTESSMLDVGAGTAHGDTLTTTSSTPAESLYGAAGSHLLGVQNTRANPTKVNNYGKQNLYLKYPPVCYNAGRCVPKTSHSLVGVESSKTTATSKVLSSALPHQANVTDLVEVASLSAANGIPAMDATAYFKDCKPAGACTVTVYGPSPSPSGQPLVETRRVKARTNLTHFTTEQTFKHFTPSSTATLRTRVRYVTGTGSVSTSGVCTSLTSDVGATDSCGAYSATNKAAYTVTGASKETKTKFNSEVSHGWTITICSTTTSAKKCDQTATKETANIQSVTSDTKLTTSESFNASFYKRKYLIGNIPALGLVSSAQASKIVDGDTNTRFLQQMKVGYTLTVNSETRTITAISSNSLLSIDSAFTSPPDSKTSALFSGKEGTGEVTVNSGGATCQGTGGHPTGYSCAAYASAQAPKTGGAGYEPRKVVVGTLDVTQTRFQNELALGYLFMVGNDYKVVTKITSDTMLEVDTPFLVDGTKVAYDRNDYNYESCWLSHPTNDAAQGANTANDGNGYTNKKVYVEDACEIKPGCCGFKVSSVVYPDRFAYYKIRPPHTNMNIRVVVKTTEDNVDVLVKKSAVPTTASYHYKSVRESNPWALTVPQTAITCGTWSGWSNTLPPANCDYWYIGVRGDNRYPQKTGASEYDLYVYTEFDWPNFVCTDAKSDQANNKCKWLGIMNNEDATMHTNDDSQYTMRLTDNTNQRKGSMYYSTKVHLYDGFETSFQFRMTGFSVGCNSVLYPSGFCGGGDGFAFVIQPHDDKQIACTGSGLGYSKVLATKQGNDWNRHRCTSLGSNASIGSNCDTNDDGLFTDWCGVDATTAPVGSGKTGALCKVTNANNGGCGDTGVCGFQNCDKSIDRVLAIEFDTWNNLKLHDPKQGVSRWWINATEFVGYNDNHVAIFSSNSAMQSDHSLNEHFAATPSVPNLADGKSHTVKVKYWPQLIDDGKEFDGDYNRTDFKRRGALHTSSISTCGDCMDTGTTLSSPNPSPDDCYKCQLRNHKPGNLALFVDDMKRPVLQTSISLRKGATSNCYDNDRDRCILDERGNAYIGFTAATGGERAFGRTTAGVHNTCGAAHTAGGGYSLGSDSAQSGCTVARGAATENAGKMLGAAQNHEILNWKFCNRIGCVPI